MFIWVKLWKQAEFHENKEGVRGLSVDVINELLPTFRASPLEEIQLIVVIVIFEHFDLFFLKFEPNSVDCLQFPLDVHKCLQFDHFAEMLKDEEDLPYASAFAADEELCWLLGRKWLFLCEDCFEGRWVYLFEEIYASNDFLVILLCDLDARNSLWDEFVVCLGWEICHGEEWLMDQSFLMLFYDECDFFQGLALTKVKLFLAFVDGLDERMVINEVLQLSSLMQL